MPDGDIPFGVSFSLRNFFELPRSEEGGWAAAQHNLMRIVITI